MATHIVSTPCLAPHRDTFSLARFWSTAGAMLRTRRTRRLLTEMDHRLLADIGASRADAAMEANRPFWDIR